MRVLFIDIDTLRADHLGCAGYHRPTTPNIDALAAEGVRFANVYASDVPCLPSRTALVTNRFGIRNGVVNHGGQAADLRPEGADRNFVSMIAARSWPAMFYWAGWRTASLSSFPLRHSASWWTSGFMEAMNLMRGMGKERADEVVPHALDWLDRNGAADRWFLHVHLWDPHTPYRTPLDYGEPFADDPIPAWYSEEVRARHWTLPGPHSAQEVTGFDVYGVEPYPRQPARLPAMDDVKRLFDGYDTGIRYADDAVGTLLDKLAGLGVLDDTLVLVSSDHGEAFGELGVYADHQGADEATCHIPAILRMPGLAPRVYEGLHYHLDVAATVADLVDAPVGDEDTWDGRSVKAALLAGEEAGRDHLVLSQGAWTCQRGVRWGDHLYLRTWHDGFHGWPEEMLFDVGKDPHEQHDLLADEPERAAAGRARLETWTAEQLARTPGHPDPMQTVLAEGGPFHVRGRLAPYLDRLRSTGRGHWINVLAQRHPAEPAPARA